MGCHFPILINCTLVDIEKEDWARKMQCLLRRACHVASLARERGVILKPRMVERLERRYDAILVEGLSFHQAQPPLAPVTVKGGYQRRGRRAELDIISSCASQPASKTPCASS